MHRLGLTRIRPVSRAVIAVLTGAFAATAFPAVAAADATDDYPIPHRIIVTTCTAEQILAAARDFAPIYYERYIIDKHNKSPEVQQAAIDNAHYFFSLSQAGSPSLLRTYGDEFRRSDDRIVAQLGEDLLQQQGRRRQGNRQLHQLPTRRHVRVGRVSECLCSHGLRPMKPSVGELNPIQITSG